MSSPATCVQVSSAFHRHSREEDMDVSLRAVFCQQQDFLNHSQRATVGINRDCEEDPLLQLRPDPETGNIQGEDITDEDNGHGIGGIIHVSVPHTQPHMASGIHQQQQQAARRRLPAVLVVNEPTPYSAYVVEAMRRKLKFYFMDPVDKWKARRQIPWKLLLQIIKIVVITVQLGLFGTARYSHMNFYEDNKVALCNLFLKDWDPQREIEAYPPNQGPYAVYTKQQFYDHVDHIVNAYATIRETAIGSYDYIHANVTQSPVTICKTYYKKAVIFGFNESFIFDSNPETGCLDVVPVFEPGNGTTPVPFDSQTFFTHNNFSIVFERLINVEVMFSLRYILLRALEPMDSPDCYQFNVKVTFDNGNHDSVMVIGLDIDQRKLHCHNDVVQSAAECGDQAASSAVAVQCPRQTESGNVVGDHTVAAAFEEARNAKYELEVALLNVLNSVVIIICVLSFLLCLRAIIRAQVLKLEAVLFFERHFGKNLTVNDKLEFLNVWYVMIIIDDVLIVIGSCIKIQIENKVADGDMYNVCSILLGTGSLLVWIGILRYLNFFPKYNILILTMRRAVPDVLRFLLCAMLMYFGFIFCGWLVLGPYHIKFRSMSSTAECLFSLINGDDMYATFTILSVKSGLVWWYSRIYMYSFISMFVYVVLSLFIAVIMDTYETIKSCYQHGFPQSDLMEFVAECRDDISSGIFCQHSVDPWANIANWFRNCFRRDQTSERQPLIRPK